MLDSNIRELVNVVSHVLTFSDGEDIDVSHLPARLQGPCPSTSTLSRRLDARLEDRARLEA